MSQSDRKPTKRGKRTPTIPERDGSGRVAAFKPTPEQRQLVQNLAGVGCSHDDILLVVPNWGRPDGKPISAPTLRKHFRGELDRGKALANMKVKKSLFDMTQSGNLGATIFWLKTQCGWKETTVVEQTGKDGAPLVAPAQTFVYLPVKDERPEEQDVRQTRPARCAAAVPVLPETVAPVMLPPALRREPDSEARVVGQVAPQDPHITKRFRL